VRRFRLPVFDTEKGIELRIGPCLPTVKLPSLPIGERQKKASRTEKRTNAEISPEVTKMR